MKLNWGWSIGIVYTIFVLAMIIFAVKASNQKYDLVTDNYYDEAVKYQEKIDAGFNAANAGTKISIQYLKGSSELEVESTGKEKIISGTLSFYKPDKASDDFKLDFKTDLSGKQSISMANLSHGYWKVQVSWLSDGKECLEEKRIFIQ